MIHTQTHEMLFEVIQNNLYKTLILNKMKNAKENNFFCDRQLKDHGWMVNGVKPQTSRMDRLPWFSYHSADAVPIEGTVLW